jgi:hypothetical protein
MGTERLNKAAFMLQKGVGAGLKYISILAIS